MPALAARAVPSPVQVWAEVHEKYARPYPPVASTVFLARNRWMDPSSSDIATTPTQAPWRREEIRERGRKENEPCPWWDRGRRIQRSSCNCTGEKHHRGCEGESDQYDRPRNTSFNIGFRKYKLTIKVDKYEYLTDEPVLLFRSHSTVLRRLSGRSFPQVYARTAFLEEICSIYISNYCC